MNVLLLTCHTGEGHNAVAAAIQQVMEADGVPCKTVDALSFLSESISVMVSKGHTFLYRRLPGVFRRGYRLAENHREIFEAGTPTNQFFALGAKKLYEFCRAGEYDTIVCTHAFAALMLTMVKQTYTLEAKTAFVATDYTCSPSAEQEELDWCFIPDPLLAGEFRRCGIAPDSILSSGIPIRQAFFVAGNKATAKTALGIPVDDTHLVMMCGSMGCGPMKKLAKKLSHQLTDRQQLTVVCGNNKKLYKSLARIFRGHTQVHLLGFTREIPQLLDSADLYMTKPGGISTTEAAAKGVPMVLVDAVAGCETYNMHYFVCRGCAVAARDPHDLCELCVSLLNDEAARRRMEEAFEGVNRQNGAQFIYDYLRGLQ